MKIFTLRHSWPVILEAKRRESILLAMALAFAVFTACDSSSSSADPDPIAEVSSSSGDDEVFSSSSVTDKGTSSGGSSVSSSDFFSSSSKTETVKSSSSALPKSSSSASIADQKIPCDKPEYVIYHIGNEEFVCKDSVLVPYIPPSSSSVQVRPFKERFKVDSVFNEEKTYGTFEDPRDGQKYRTIVIKTKSATSPEFEVFAQNLNYGSQVNLGASVFDDNKVEKFCYDDDPWYCDNYFGGLYSWSETFGLPRACDSVWTGTTSNCPDSIATGIDSDFDWDYLQIQGVCPDGWHVMNENEWRAMIGADESAYRATSKASKGSNGNGFSALYGGACGTGFENFEEIVFRGLSENASFWLQYEKSDNRARSIFISDKQLLNIIQNSRPKENGHYVRCVKDYSFTI
ncbi:major paralogous domain-containing protein [Fibrobacter sp. UWOV1]|uniref:FISUMP domain-containing protein n=1 Tax=Fibrobacter sp. UWOV1 TaxID=1896215 RepID=UPI0009214FBF|nr:FISUMP domain-containing protein [Fibrobacter sp. UWOV1]SHL35392.1 major paralogous domain-containing protein [Fibrobacter sp. UWOV1]